ncbi:MAG TPA: DUF3108 domain-containing protein [Balneolales bacterium]|nr:DUF3108 domain-containing protein [Balneolales bacterium]
MKRILATGLLIILTFGGLSKPLPANRMYVSNRADNDSIPLVRQLWKVREHLVYSVRYSFFNLGTVTVDVLHDTTYMGKKYRYFRTEIKSNPSLPFVGDKEEDFYSLMARNDTIPYEVLYWNDDVDDHIHFESLYKLRYDLGKVYTFKRKKSDGPLIAGDTLPLNQPSICGPAFFYLSRIYAGTTKNVSIPIYINQKKDSIQLFNTGKWDKMQVDAFGDKPIKVFVSSGDAGFNGPFGFHGKFTAWFAEDSLHVPVATNLHVWIGNVKVRLKSYTAYNYD